jgi:hypothetical protein
MKERPKKWVMWAGFSWPWKKFSGDVWPIRLESETQDDTPRFCAATPKDQEWLTDLLNNCGSLPPSMREKDE